LPLFEVETIETVGVKNSQNLVLHGDCLNAIAYLRENNIKVDLVYIDPPFASNANYSKKIYIRRNPEIQTKIKEVINKAKEDFENDSEKSFEEVMYSDIWRKEDYLSWLYERLLAIKSVMSDKASIYVHLDWHIGHYVKIMLDEIFGEENFRNEIVWAYRIQGINQKSFARKHDTIFLYSKNENYLFNPEKEENIYENPFIDTLKKEADLSSLKETDIKLIIDCLNNKKPIPIKSKMSDKMPPSIAVCR